MSKHFPFTDFKIEYNIFSCHFDVIEHGIHHPPTTKPWEAPEIPETSEIFINKDGVYNVYRDEEAVKQGKPNDYSYPDVVQFTTDFYTMCNMIADGPL